MSKHVGRGAQKCGDNHRHHESDGERAQVATRQGRKQVESLPGSTSAQPAEQQVPQVSHEADEVEFA